VGIINGRQFHYSLFGLVKILGCFSKMAEHIYCLKWHHVQILWQCSDYIYCRMGVADYVAMITIEQSHSLKVTVHSCCLQSHWFYVGDSCDLVGGMDLGIDLVWVSLLYWTWHVQWSICLIAFIVHPLLPPSTFLELCSLLVKRES